MIFAGKLRHRVTVQHLVAGSPQQTASGQPDTSWQEFMTVWASIEPLNGRELFAAQEHHAEVTHRVRMRYHDGITPLMRVKFGDRYFGIFSVIDLELRGRELQLMCSEGFEDA
jgi:SPP1 family predicted phage head-tail adaptor